MKGILRSVILGLSACGVALASATESSFTLNPDKDSTTLLLVSGKDSLSTILLTFFLVLKKVLIKGKLL
jgi:hypothetical protein